MLSKENIKQLFGNLKEIVAANDSKKEADLTLLTNRVSANVKEFLTNQHLVSASPNGRATVAVESLGTELNSFDGNKIIDLLKECNIHQSLHQEAGEALLVVLAKHATVGAGSQWGSQLVKADEAAEPGTTFLSLESVYGQHWGQNMSDIAPAQESFGVDMDRATPDIKMDLTVAIMRFHADLTAKMLPIRPTSEPSVRYTKTNLEIHDTVDTNAPIIQMVDLYEDGGAVENQLKKIIPLNANDATLVPQDGILVFGQKANILELSVDATIPGYTMVNRTDLVADNARMEKIHITLDDATNGPESFTVEIPTFKGRLTRNHQNSDVAERFVNFEHSKFLTTGDLVSAGTPSAVLAAICADATEGLQLTLMVSATINLKYGITWANCSITVEKISLAGAALSTQLTNASIANTIYGYELDARFSEENMRKSNIAAFTSRQGFNFEIPMGRNYMVDYSLQQQNADQNAAYLTKLIRVGQGKRTLNSVIQTLNNVEQLVADYKAGMLPKNITPGHSYVAGSLVRPYVFSDTMDLNNLLRREDSNRSGDIKQYALTYLTAAISKLAVNSFLHQQLTEGVKPVYRLVTSNFILDNILSQPHTHNHLQRETEKDGIVEYRLVLPSGVIVDCVTTTQSEMSTRMLIYPILPDSKESELNFGHNWDYGTMVAHYTTSSNGMDRSANNRLFANTRELPIPTNPVGAIIDVANIDNAVILNQ